MRIRPDAGKLPLPSLLASAAILLALAWPLPAAEVKGVWCNHVDQAIPDANEVGIFPAIDISTGVPNASIDSIQVYVALRHTYVGDLSISLLDPALASRLLISTPGAPPCAEDDIAATFTDFAFDYGDDVCDATPRAIHGIVRPDEPFYLYQPRLLNGTWTLHIADTATTDIGTFNAWCLLSGVVYYDGFESGDALEWSAHAP